MTDEPIDLQAAIREAAQRISAEARAAIDLYVLEQGPLRLEREGWGYKFVARQEVRLRLKEAEEIRADERERAAERVAALRLWDYCYDHDCRMQAGAVAAIRGGGA